MNMTTSTLEKLAIRTESVVPDLNNQEAQLRMALNLAIIAGEILDQVKRKIFYGEKGGYKPEKLNAAAEKLAQIDAFDFTADEFTSMAAKTPAAGIDTRVVHGIVGVLTEGAELAEALVKALDTGTMDHVNLIEETADVDWYTAVLRDAFNFPLEGIYQFLIAKLSARYPDKFTDEAATIRDIGAERDVMERFLKEYGKTV